KGVEVCEVYITREAYGISCDIECRSVVIQHTEVAVNIGGVIGGKRAIQLNDIESLPGTCKARRAIKECVETCHSKGVEVCEVYITREAYGVSRDIECGSVVIQHTEVAVNIGGVIGGKRAIQLNDIESLPGTCKAGRTIKECGGTCHSKGVEVCEVYITREAYGVSCDIE